MRLTHFMNKTLKLTLIAIILVNTIFFFSSGTTDICITSTKEFCQYDLDNYQISCLDWNVKNHGINLVYNIPCFLHSKNTSAYPTTQIVIRYCEQKNFVDYNYIFVGDKKINNYNQIPNDTLLVPSSLLTIQPYSNLFLCGEEFPVDLEYYNLVHINPPRQQREIYGYVNRDTFLTIHSFYQKNSLDTSYIYCMESTLEYSNLLALFFVVINNMNENTSITWSNMSIHLVSLVTSIFATFYTIYGASSILKKLY